MVDEHHEPGELAGEVGLQSQPWAWHPPLPIEYAPFFVWPPRPVEALKWFFSVALMWSLLMPLAALAVVTWFYLQPALERCVEFRADWIVQMYARNLAVIVLVAGGLHLFFYAFKGQGSQRKFDPREPSKNSPRFLGRNQVWDNVFWSCASGVTIWTAYEVLFMWAYANDTLPYLDWSDNPIWFVLLFVVIHFWQSTHFYWTHRLLHWKPLYNMAHALHHRNVNIGPWSGISMHPVEHIIYFSSVAIHLVVASHPIHLLFHMQYLVLGAVTGHTGFADLLVKGKPRLALGSFFHQQHHRYFSCNYGDENTPWDKWLGAFHDGTPEATARLRQGRATVEVAETGSA